MTHFKNWIFCLSVSFCFLWGSLGGFLRAEEGALPVLLEVQKAEAAGKEIGRADSEGAETFNRSLHVLKEELKEKFNQAAILASQAQGGGNEMGAYRGLLGEVRAIKGKIRALEESWRRVSVDETARGEEAYALWDMGETTLSQLIMEYGANDYLYVVPQELSGMKISLYSSIPLPHESWSEMIEMILAQNGIGLKKLNSLAKQLYILKLDPSGIEGIVSREEDLPFFANHARIFYVFSPPADQTKSVQAFFERFSDPKQTTLQIIGSKVAIVSSKETVEKLLGLYRAVWEQSRGKIIRIVNLTKIQIGEAEKILKAVFTDSGNKNRPGYYSIGADELATFLLPQGLVLVGENDTVQRAETILADLESQLEDPSEKIIYWYCCKHSNPEDIAGVLEKVYDSLVGSAFEKKADLSSPQPATCPSPSAADLNAVPGSSPNPSSNQGPFPYITPGTPPGSPPGTSPAIFPGAPFNPVLPATAPFVQPATLDKNQKSAFGSFIVDSKTTSILMVVRREDLPKIKILLKKLDVPKKMVQLDVLLVEKKLTDRKQVGFNLLQIGTNASGKKETALSFDANRAGLMSFIFRRESGDHFPASDMIFNFLMAQEDVRINANPSVLAINQTPANVSIVEEISINNGAFPINTPTGVVVEKSFTRAQYGITIKLTPTIQTPDLDEEGPGFVMLETNLEFDTTQMGEDSRPPVTRRHIENQVRVADGETIILGGLRRKIEEDKREKIPFLCDLPGLGKLFTTLRTTETNTEMFIFITPHIIRDPIDDLRRIRQCEYQKRAGDLPEFLARIDEAKEQERACLFKNSLKTLFSLN
jgi:general secretion pathway protein D